MHWESLFGMDFMTVDTIFGKRIYVLIIMQLKSREIVKVDFTEYPTLEFVRQRIIDFTFDRTEKITLIHDNTPQFKYLHFQLYGIKAVNITPYSPNLNAFTERVIGSIRREALDHFLLISEKQVRQIVNSYVDYYNNYRPHQGISDIPAGFKVHNSGTISKKAILSGLHHHYYRSAA